MNKKSFKYIVLTILCLICFAGIVYATQAWAPPKSFKGGIKPWAPPKSVPAPQSWAPPKSYAKPVKAWNPPKEYPKPKQWKPPKSFKRTIPDKVIDKKPIETTRPVDQKPITPSTGDPIIKPDPGIEPKIEVRDNSQDNTPKAPVKFEKQKENKERRTFPRRMEQTPLPPERKPLYPDSTTAPPPPPPPIYPSPTNTYYPEKDYNYDPVKSY